ncbi:MAG: sulfotransferase [Sphingorhabdus sp.]
MVEIRARTNTHQRLAEIDDAIRKRDLARAEHLVHSFNRDEPRNVEGWVAHARVSQMVGDHLGMRAWLKTALDLAPDYPLALLMDAEALVHLGEVLAARHALESMEGKAANDGAWLARIAEIYTHCGQFEKAAGTARKAHRLDPDDAAIRYNLASSLIATGCIEEAEDHFDAIIRQTPHDYDAYYNRANLRKQTPENNHIDEIRALLSTPLKHAMGTVQLHYALAKELEDVGRHEESFAALKSGADARRKMLSYNVSSDIPAMAKIAENFGESFFAREHCSSAQEGPIFIVGFPRSGTTLVDRILSAHSSVESLGELTDFAVALTALCNGQKGKSNLIDAAVDIDMRALGEVYVKRAKERSQGRPFFIDKTPANFLYIGLIAAALPQAKIIHVNRDLNDNGYGMYKALFRMGYPFSYDLGDLASYMIAKEKLMAHWRTVLPGQVIDIHYEDIVADQEGESRKLLQALGLDWEAACLEFHKNKSPTATASAAQVRRPIYKSAVNRWKLYEAQLKPLIDALGAAT